MKSSYIPLFSLSMAVLSLACKEKKAQQVATPEITFTKEAELYFTKPSGDTITHVEIELAKTGYEQQTGLMYRKSMQANRGMLFMYKDEKPRPYFYMKNTYIDLDLIYLDQNYHIVDFNENAKAFDESTLASGQPAQYVLEVNAGMVKNWKLEIGDKMILNIGQ